VIRPPTEAYTKDTMPVKGYTVVEHIASRETGQQKVEEYGVEQEEVKKVAAD